MVHFLPSAVVTLYSTYLLYSSLASDPSSCNPTPTQHRSEAEIWIGLVIAACSIGYAGWNVSTNSDRLFNAQEENPNSSSPILDNERGTTKKGDGGGDEDVGDLESGTKKEKSVQKESDIDGEEAEKEVSSEDAAEMRKTNAIFHFVMFAAACYMAMLLSNWGVFAESDGSLSSVDISKTSLWVKLTVVNGRR
eukprot:TRINITY_DN2328_c0_g1_i1.p1 TRINITY_DN2328_c0_g1~~TRINITY_DN2328_c0_g1_i1.p1  ORF type:complete len:193 (-),score=44.70 TRINITY_DN2328_c0_g1_i1:35-613(-)